MCIVTHVECFRVTLPYVDLGDRGSEMRIEIPSWSDLSGRVAYLYKDTNSYLRIERCTTRKANTQPSSIVITIYHNLSCVGEQMSDYCREFYRKVEQALATAWNSVVQLTISHHWRDQHNQETNIASLESNLYSVFICVCIFIYMCSRAVSWLLIKLPSSASVGSKRVVGSKRQHLSEL